MSHADLRAKINAAWREATHPLTPERALELANEVLKSHPREKAQFAEWFALCGETALARRG